MAGKEFKHWITPAEFLQQHQGALQEWLEDRHGKDPSHPVDLYCSAEVFYSVAWHIAYYYIDEKKED